MAVLYNLPSDQVPPTIAGMLWGSIDDSLESAWNLLAEIQGVPRKPPVTLPFTSQQDRMSLSGQQQRDLIYAIAESFDYEQLELALTPMGVRLVQETTMLKVADELVKTVIRLEQVETLVEHLLKEQPNQQVFQLTAAILSLSEYQSAVGTNGQVSDGDKSDDTDDDYYESYWLSGTHPFLDRSKTRAIARHWNNSGIKILAVNGEKNTGKTHTKELIFHVYREQKKAGQSEFTPIFVNLASIPLREESDTVSALDLVTDIVNQIKEIKELPGKYETNFLENREQTARWAKAVGSWLTGELLESSRVYWVIIDGFGEVALDPSVTDFLDDLIERVSNNLDAFRLILLGYDIGNFVNTRVKPEEENITDLTEPSLSRDLYREVGRFLYKAHPASFAGLEGTDLGDRIGDISLEVIGNIDSSVGGQMHTLAEALARKVAELQEVN